MKIYPYPVSEDRGCGMSENKTQNTNDWFWNSCEDGLFNGPFATMDLAINDAVYGNASFEDEETKCIFLLEGYSYPNPDYDAKSPQDEDNAPERLCGKTVEFTKTQAIDWCLTQIDDLRAKLKKQP